MGWNYLVFYEVTTFRCIIWERPTCLSKPTLRNLRFVFSRSFCHWKLMNNMSFKNKFIFKWTRRQVDGFYPPVLQGHIPMMYCQLKPLKSWDMVSGQKRISDFFSFKNLYTKNIYNDFIGSNWQYYTSWVCVPQWESYALKGAERHKS